MRLLDHPVHLLIIVLHIIIIIKDITRYILVNIAKHQSAVKQSSKKTGLDKHVPETGHGVLWDMAKVIKHELHWLKWKLLESSQENRG